MRHSHPRLSILWISRLAGSKRPLDFVEIARRLPQHKFIMVGDGLDREILQGIATACKSLPNFIFLGRKMGDEKEQSIRNCDIYVTTSDFEGFGLTVMEAMKSGKPVVARPIPVFLEVYEDKLCYADTIEKFVERIRALEDEKLRELIGSKGREFVQKYSWERAGSKAGSFLGPRTLAICDDDPHALWGGYVVFLQLCRNMRRRPRIVSPEGVATDDVHGLDIRHFRNFRDDGQPPTPASLMRTLLFFFRLFTNSVAEMPFDVIFSIDGRCAAVSYLLKIIFRKKLVFSMADCSNFLKPLPKNPLRALYKILELRAYRSSDTVLTMSETMKRNLVSHGMRRVHVIWD